MTTDPEQKLEIEIKIRIRGGSIELENTRKKIIAIGSRLIHKKYFERNIVFDTPGGKLKNNKSLLRLRKKENKNIVTFKRPAHKPASLSSTDYKIREEIEVEVSDFENTKRIFTGLGYEVVFIYEKYREEFRKGAVKVMVDETPIGNFIEIEGPGEAIDRTARELGCGKTDYIIENYRTLFRKAGGTGDMKFREPGV